MTCCQKTRVTKMLSSYLIVDEWRENKRVSFIFRSTVNAGVNDDGII